MHVARNMSGLIPEIFLFSSVSSSTHRSFTRRMPTAIRFGTGTSKLVDALGVCRQTSDRKELYIAGSLKASLQLDSSDSCLPYTELREHSLTPASSQVTYLLLLTSFSFTSLSYYYS